ncbi:hypothetical protein ACIQCD_16285 [Streptomyces sp. NPDC093250]|uniref:hypothetical protein n=1 Tax=Streptomyces sp. NPDC093250 TaxID=3366036 RepID=UPI00381558C2
MARPDIHPGATGAEFLRTGTPLSAKGDLRQRGTLVGDDLPVVILNKAMSLVVVLVALPARLAAVSVADVASRRPVAVNLLAGSLLGAWAGASWAVRMRSATLYRVLAALPAARGRDRPPHRSRPDSCEGRSSSGQQQPLAAT